MAAFFSHAGTSLSALGEADICTDAALAPSKRGHELRTGCPRAGHPETGLHVDPSCLSSQTKSCARDKGRFVLEEAVCGYHWHS